MQIYDREKKSHYTEKQFADKKLHLLYKTPTGRLLLRVAISRRWFSNLLAVPNNLQRSTRKIPAFIKEFEIDMERFEKANYKSFNDFFTRRINPKNTPQIPKADILAAPADAKLLAYPINEQLCLSIKEMPYKVSDLLGNLQHSANFSGGMCLVFRLTVDDYHRFSYIDSGTLIESQNLPGTLHTVGPYSDGKIKVLSQNHRIVSLLKTENFGKVAEIDVGALMVGRICIHKKPNFSKGEERGYFSYGGSTIVLLFEAGKIELCEDIRQQSQNGIETRVRLGDKVGRKFSEKES